MKEFLRRIRLSSRNRILSRRNSFDASRNSENSCCSRRACKMSLTLCSCKEGSEVNSPGFLNMRAPCYETGDKRSNHFLCRGGPPWPPQVCHIVFPRWGGHGGPPLQLR